MSEPAARCPIPCDATCDQPCHSVHQVGAMRLHRPEDCPSAVSAAALDPGTTFPNIPEGWRVLWCPVCLYAVTFTDADANTYGVEWEPAIREAAEHEH